MANTKTGLKRGFLSCPSSEKSSQIAQMGRDRFISGHAPRWVQVSILVMKWAGVDIPNVSKRRRACAPRTCQGCDGNLNECRGGQLHFVLFCTMVPSVEGRKFESMIWSAVSAESRSQLERKGRASHFLESIGRRCSVFSHGFFVVGFLFVSIPGICSNLIGLLVNITILAESKGVLHHSSQLFLK